jgi:hypothetical protein
MKALKLLSATGVACCCLAAVVLLGGCSSLKVTETWRSSAGPGHTYQKLMIIAIGRDETVRTLFENIVVDEMEQQHIRAVASHTLVKVVDKATREDIVAAVRAAGCDAVLTTRPVSVGDDTVTQQGRGSVVYGAGSPASADYLRATLQTNLYDAATTELVWSATVKTFDADNRARVSRDLGLFFIERLRRDGLL